MGMQERVKAGYWMGGNGVPFGYDYDSNQDILVPNEHANDVRAIYDLYLKGYTTTQLAKMFPVSGDRQIGLILDRVTYLGKIQYKGEVFQGRHQALVDENTWHRAQLERKRRSSKNAVTSSYLLTGLLVCGKCGAKMRYQTWSSGQLKIVCYSRQRSKMSLVKDPNCDNPRIDARELEKVVTDDLFRLTDRITVSEQRFPAENSDREAENPPPVVSKNPPITQSMARCLYVSFFIVYVLARKPVPLLHCMLNKGSHKQFRMCQNDPMSRAAK